MASMAGSPSLGPAAMSRLRFRMGCNSRLTSWEEENWRMKVRCSAAPIGSLLPPDGELAGARVGPEPSTIRSAKAWA
jgi:hypothetical protein